MSARVRKRTSLGIKSTKQSAELVQRPQGENINLRSTLAMWMHSRAFYGNCGPPRWKAEAIIMVILTKMVNATAWMRITLNSFSINKNFLTKFHKFEYLKNSKLGLFSREEKQWRWSCHRLQSGCAQVKLETSLLNGMEMNLSVSHTKAVIGYKHVCSIL